MLNNVYHYIGSVCEIAHVSQMLWMLPHAATAAVCPGKPILVDIYDSTSGDHGF